MGFSGGGVPKGIRTPVTAVKGRCPRPLDDGDATAGRWGSRTWPGKKQPCWSDLAAGSGHANPQGHPKKAIALLLLRCEDRCDALCGLRPTSRDTRHHLVDQLARLGQHLLIATRRRAKDELGHAASDIGGDALDNRFGI